MNIQKNSLRKNVKLHKRHRGGLAFCESRDVQELTRCKDYTHSLQKTAVELAFANRNFPTINSIKINTSKSRKKNRKAINCLRSLKRGLA